MKLNQHSNSTTIYLEQIQNHIELGQGYDKIRKHLFRELYRLDGENIVADDKLPESIVIHLANVLVEAYNFHKSQQVFRIIQIVEDLMTYADQIMTPALHHELFLSALLDTAKPKMISFNSDVDLKCRNRVYGIFIYWDNRYSKDQVCAYPLFIEGYQKIKYYKCQYNEQTAIKTNNHFRNDYQYEKNQKKGQSPKTEVLKSANRIMLEEIEQFTMKSQELSKQSIKNVATTQYVRLIKHKSKVLFEFTSKPGDFNEKQKGKVKDFYKRLRVILKQIEKYNENAVQIKKNKISQTQYIQQKLTPKKSQQSLQQNTEMSSSQKKNDILKNKQSQKQIKIVTPEKVLSNKMVKTQSFDLLQFGFDNKEVQPNIQKKESLKTNTTTVPSKPLFQTFDLLGDIQPVKQQEEEEQFVDGILIDVNPISISPKQQKKQLEKVFSTPKKETQEESQFMPKQNSNSSNHSFQNEKKVKNPYSFIPNDLNLTPNSSNQDEEQPVKQKSGFNFFGLLKGQNKDKEKQIYDNEKKPYDDSPYRKNKQSPLKTQIIKNEAEIIFPEMIVQQYQQEIQKKYVQPIDYSKYILNKSPESDYSVQDEQNKLQAQKQQQGNKDLAEITFQTRNSAEKIKIPEQ